MTIKKEFLVTPQSFQTDAWDKNDVPVSSYYTGNRIVWIHDDGSREQWIFDADTNQPSANWIGIEHYDASGRLLIKWSGFSHFMSTASVIHADALANIKVVPTNAYLTDLNDRYWFDPAQDNLKEARVTGNTIDGRLGEDTFYDSYWKYDDFEIVKKSASLYLLTFEPTDETIELRNFEKIQFADTDLLTIEGFYQLKNRPTNSPAIFTQKITDGPYKVGDKLTTEVVFNDKNGKSSSVLWYQWFRVDSEGTATQLRDASQIYVVQDTDVGNEIQFSVSFNDDDGYTEISPRVKSPAGATVEALVSSNNTGSVSSSDSTTNPGDTSVGLLPTPTVQITQAFVSLWDTAPGYSYLSQYLGYEKKYGIAATIDSFANLNEGTIIGGTDASFIALFLKNLGLIQDILAKAFMADAVLSHGRGAAITNFFSELQNNSRYAGASEAFDKKVTKGVSFSTNPANTTTNKTELATAINDTSIEVSSNTSNTENTSNSSNSSDSKNSATGSNKIVNSTPGNDNFPGGLAAGDQVTFLGPVTSYTITGIFQGKNDALSGYSIYDESGSDGTDTVDLAVEYLVFSDDTKLETGNASIFRTGSTAAYNEITGSKNADIIKGTRGNDKISASDGNDSITFSDGKDLIDGGAGIDTLILKTGSQNAVHQSTFEKAAIFYESEISVGDHSVQIGGIERLQFTDKSFARDTEALISGAGMVARAIISGFGVGSLDQYLGLGLALADSGQSREQILDLIGTSSLGTLSNREFTSRVVENVAGFTPDDDTLHAYTNLVDSDGRVNFLELASEYSGTTEIMKSKIQILGLPYAIDA